MRIYNSTITGSLKIKGDIDPENYIVNTTVTTLTQSFSSGSTIFGDSGDDTHQFTGSLFISGSRISIDDGRNNTLSVMRAMKTHTTGHSNIVGYQAYG